MKSLKKLCLFATAMVMFSCSNDSGEGKIQLKLSAVNNPGNTGKSVMPTGKGNENVIFTDFKISIRDVVFKNDDDPNSNLDTDEIQFRGPFKSIC